jgi:Enoyl-CoA hydratase/isomerase
VAAEPSKSLARRRHLPNQAKVRSTTQRRGNSWKPLTPGGARQSRLSTVAGGFETALAADIRIASENAQFGSFEARRGFHHGDGGIARLVNFCGVGIALEMLLTAEPIDAQRALQINLVSKVVPHDKLMETAEVVAKTILRNDQASVRSAKQVTLDMIGRNLDDQLGLRFLYLNGEQSDGSGPALDGSEDIVGGFGPLEWLGIGIVMTDEVHNVGAQSLDAAIDAAPDLFVGDEREEALDLIEPGRAGRREMDMPARSFGEPVADQRGLVRGVIVHDEMDIETARDGSLDLVEELAELGGAVAGKAFADDLARRDVERRKERGGAVARVVMAAPRRLTGAHGQHGLAAVERLNLGLLVHAQDDGVLGRGDVEADHIAHLGHEIRVGRELERLDPMRLQTEGSPDALHA